MGIYRQILENLKGSMMEPEDAPVLGYAFVRKIALPKGRALLGAVLFGVTSMGLSFTFIYWRLVETPASLYQTIVALVPLLTLFFAAVHRLESFCMRRLLGALLTVVGIIVAVGGASGGDLSIPHVLAIIAGAACFAEAGIIAKRLPRSHPVAINAVAMPVGALILAIASFLSGEKMVIPHLGTKWIAFTYIVIFVLIPLVTIFLASWLAEEQITLQFVVGGTLV